MKTFLRLVVVVLAMLAAAQFVTYYAPTWYQTVAFTAPIVGAMSYAVCALGVTLMSMLVAVFSK